MTNLDSWQAQTKELLDRVEAEMKELQDEFDRRLSLLMDERYALSRALESYSQRMGTETAKLSQRLSPSDVKGKGYADILKVLAERNNGLLVVRAAIRLMKDAGVFGDSSNAAGIVYSTIKRSRHFVKVGKGVYKLNGHEKGLPAGEAEPKRIRGQSTGLVNKVSSLLDEHPDWKPLDILKALQEERWDFGNKKASSSVTIAYARVIKDRSHAPSHPQLSL